MEEQANVQLRPGASPEKRRVSEFIKRIPQFRWKSTEEEQDLGTLTYGRESSEALFNRHHKCHTLLDDNPSSG